VPISVFPWSKFTQETYNWSHIVVYYLLCYLHPTDNALEPRESSITCD